MGGKIPPVIKRLIKITKKFMLYLIITGLFFLLLSRLITAVYSLNRIHSPENITPTPVAIVFGAGLWRDGSPTPILRDRVVIAANLYFAGKVEKILMSGDNRFIDYNEPAAMLNYALELGVPGDAIILDYAGRRTYDTCFRARDIFGLQEVILVTQGFHLPRALYTCGIMGLESTGVPAGHNQYSNRLRFFWQIRETLATLVALIDLHITNPLPVLGEPEPIF